MARRKQNKEFDRIEAGIKAVLAVLIFVAFLTGGINGFGQRLIALILLVVLSGVCIAALVGIVAVIRKTTWRPSRAASRSTAPQMTVAPTQKTTPTSSTAPKFAPQPVKVFKWNKNTILERMEQIDWYQFEKFCAALLKAEGYSVERKGGAQPDGGVDLVACKFDGNDTLIQCKHWRTWKVGEPVVRQMLGSMTDFQVKKGAIYSMKQWTQPAAAFARKHNIELVDGLQLATRAQATLSPATLEEILNNDTHHCPKCERPMVYRTGDFKPFWGCSTYPRCRGTIKAA